MDNIQPLKISNKLQNYTKKRENLFNVFQLRANSLSANIFQISCYAMNRYTIVLQIQHQTKKKFKDILNIEKKDIIFYITQILLFLQSKYAEMKVVDYV